MSAYASGQYSLEKITDFGNNPGNLKMYSYVPETVKKFMSSDPSYKCPLVVVLHGCSQRLKSIVQMSGWNDLADEHEFIVVYSRQKRKNNLHLCYNWFLPEDANRGTGEAASVADMVDYALEKYPVDQNEVFIYGLSSGASMTTAILSSYPEKFKMGMAFAGGPFKAAEAALEAGKVIMTPPDLTPEEWAKKVRDQNGSVYYPPMVIMHGRKDKVVDFRMSIELIDQWTALHNTDVIPEFVYRNYEDHPVVEKSIYLDKDGNEVVIFYAVDKTGHSVPVDPGDGPRNGGKAGLFGVDHNFFSTYYVARDFGLIKE